VVAWEERRGGGGGERLALQGEHQHDRDQQAFDAKGLQLTNLPTTPGSTRLDPLPFRTRPG
jgi:hypothetical protein